MSIDTKEMRRLHAEATQRDMMRFPLLVARNAIIDALPALLDALDASAVTIREREEDIKLLRADCEAWRRDFNALNEGGLERIAERDKEIERLRACNQSIAETAAKCGENLEKRNKELHALLMVQAENARLAAERDALRTRCKAAEADLREYAPFAATCGRYGCGFDCQSPRCQGWIWRGPRQEGAGQ